MGYPIVSYNKTIGVYLVLPHIRAPANEFRYTNILIILFYPTSILNANYCEGVWIFVTLPKQELMNEFSCNFIVI